MRIEIEKKENETQRIQSMFVIQMSNGSVHIERRVIFIKNLNKNLSSEWETSFKHDTILIDEMRNLDFSEVLLLSSFQRRRHVHHSERTLSRSQSAKRETHQNDIKIQ